jgi:nucleoside-diphosphate-sugar epimerase
VVYASSSSIYGNAEHHPTNEAMTPRPISPYGVTKLSCEPQVRLERGILEYLTWAGLAHPGRSPDPPEESVPMEV